MAERDVAWLDCDERVPYVVGLLAGKVMGLVLRLGGVTEEGIR